jgi:hypothetical protein
VQKKASPVRHDEACSQKGNRQRGAHCKEMSDWLLEEDVVVVVEWRGEVEATSPRGTKSLTRLARCTIKVLLDLQPLLTGEHVVEQVCQPRGSGEWDYGRGSDTLELRSIRQDFDSPDVYETHSPSPETRTRKLGRSNRGRASTSSDEDSDDDEDGHSDSGERSGRRGTKKVGGQDGLQGDENPDIVATALNPDEAAKRFQDASGVDGRSVGESHPATTMAVVMSD